MKRRGKQKAVNCFKKRCVCLWRSFKTLHRPAVTLLTAHSTHTLPKLSALLNRRNRPYVHMDILPTSTNSVQDAASLRTPTSRIPVMFRRLARFSQMVRVFYVAGRNSYLIKWQDFELAAWQLTYLCLAPKRVYVPPDYLFAILD